MDPLEFPKRYDGDLQALVLKASPALVGNPPGDQITNLLGKTINLGIPEEVFKDAANLVSLWRRKAPKVNKQISKRHQDPGTSSSSSGAVKEKKGAVKKKKKSPQSNKGAKSSKNRGHSRQRVEGTSKNRSHHRDDHGAIAYLVTENEGCAWGPDMTAADMMSVFARWQRFHELDEADQAKRLLEQSRQQNMVAV